MATVDKRDTVEGYYKQSAAKHDAAKNENGLTDMRVGHLQRKLAQLNRRQSNG